MESKVIYVPVSVQEELPRCGTHWGKDAPQYNVIINNGEIITSTGYAEGQWACENWSFKNKVTHWLKRIELPNELDTKSLCSLANPYTGLNWHAFNKGVIRCYQHILSIINQKK